MANDTKESVYEEIRKADAKGKGFKKEEKLFFAEELLKEGKIKKVGSKYYRSDIFPSSSEVYRKIEIAAEKGTHLTTLEAGAIQPLIDQGKIKKVGRKTAEIKYYLTEFAPLIQKEVIRRLLDYGVLKRSGKKYVFTRKLEVPPPKPPESIPSFAEFVETLQKIYLRKARRYREEVRILPLLEELTSEMDIPRKIAEKWILELPEIFVGIVDLRPFSGEDGLKLKSGAEVSRIYLERGIVGL